MAEVLCGEDSSLERGDQLLEGGAALVPGPGGGAGGAGQHQASWNHHHPR